MLALLPGFVGEQLESDYLNFIFVLAIFLGVVVFIDALGVVFRTLDRRISIFNLSSAYVAIIIGVIITGVDYSFKF